MCSTWNICVAGMCQNGSSYLLWPSLLGKNTMSCPRVVFRRRPLLIVEIMQKTRDSVCFYQRLPGLFCKPQSIGLALTIGPDARLNSQGMFEQAGGLGIFVQQRPGTLSAIRVFLGHSIFLPVFIPEFWFFSGLTHIFHLTMLVHCLHGKH